MSTPALVLIGYLLCGIVALGLFDIVTGRLRRNWNDAIVKTMGQMSEAGIGLSVRACSVLFIVVMWLFWPAVLVGAVHDLFEKKGEEEGRTGDG